MRLDAISRHAPATKHLNLAILESNSINVRIIERHITTTLTELVDTNPALALIGPRQVGKTTLALAIAERRPSIYLDLESDADRAKLSEPGLYLEQHADKLFLRNIRDSP
ncbi:AAA family ATPase [Sinorhizobium fredii]|uniref:AAA family ATPase n=1 Tax=Rhizobium fredii TaxID=380 RepID=UPI001CC226A0|nr:AAA family ATPase [Sinorhizobium fredii]